ncbi:MAG TPA: LytR C-terminal domain-containing protein [Candidatus Methanoperedens sp.]|nr:LytR C-terminal domain-containing protein [Candidatus Methanoperedens sp.]
MKGIKKVIYWHRFGQKVYDIPTNSSPILEKEIVSSEIEKTEEGLKYLSGQGVLLLLSDSISYLYEKIIDPPLKIDESFKRKLQELIKADIPEDFSEFTWDYKVDNDFDGKQKVIVFAPIKEFQVSINEVAKKLSIKIEAMETESVAATRDPNPILGILEKPDIKGKDEDSLNLSVMAEKKDRSGLYKILGVVLLAVFLVIMTVIFLPKMKDKLNEDLKEDNLKVVTPLPSPISSEESSKSANLETRFEEIKIMVQNGTTQAGLASKMAVSLKEKGVLSVESGNAESKDYDETRLVFKNELLREKYKEKLVEIIAVSDDNISIDESIQYDAIFILGLD